MAKQNGGDILHSRTYKIILLCVWLVILTVCLVNRDRFSVDGVLHYSPRNPLTAVLFMLFLFALKSLSVFIFSGILFAASGILFPLPAAIAVNVLGAAVMVSLPYWLGRKLGKDAADGILEKYPKAAALRRMRTGRELPLSFITRAINILPSDILSLYMGATGINYPRYLAGSLLGMALSLVTFPIMGMNITEPASPWFWASIVIQVLVSVFFIGGYWLCSRKKRREGEL